MTCSMAISCADKKRTWFGEGLNCSAYNSTWPRMAGDSEWVTYYCSTGLRSDTGMVKKLLRLIWLKCDGRWPIGAYTDNSARGRLNDVGHGYSRGMLMSGKMNMLITQWCCPWLWSLVVLKDKISVLGPVLDLETGLCVLFNITYIRSISFNLFWIVLSWLFLFSDAYSIVKYAVPRDAYVNGMVRDCRFMLVL